MTKSRKTYLLLCSLSVFRGILNRSVIKGFRNLLENLDSEPADFLRAYGEFFSLLAERGFSDNLSEAITQTALFDENCFSLAAAAGRENQLNKSVLTAVSHDLEAISALCSLSADNILNDYSHIEQLAEIAPALPKWKLGDGFSLSGGIRELADFYRNNGCGIFARYKAFVWRDGEICPVEHPDRIELSSFIGYNRQREKVVRNTLAFLEGKPCNNCLLYGDMGTGKSSTVKAIGNDFRPKGLRIVEMPKERLRDFPLLVDKIASLPMKFIIFIDDLSFQHQDKSYTSLKAVLEGGLAARPANALIYATSNRRHLVKESWQDRDADDIHRRDNMQETLSLSDRFGLSVCFGNPDKKEYLEIVFALADKQGIEYDSEKLSVLAERFALGKGGRSPRCAKQFVESLASGG